MYIYIYIYIYTYVYIKLDFNICIYIYNIFNIINNILYISASFRTGVGVIILGICFCCIRRCCRKRRSKDGKKGLKGAVDLKSVQLLGSTYKDKVCIRYT
jgi:hypothetical protein